MTEEEELAKILEMSKQQMWNFALKKPDMKKINFLNNVCYLKFQK